MRWIDVPCYYEASTTVVRMVRFWAANISDAERMARYNGYTPYRELWL